MKKEDAAGKSRFDVAFRFKDDGTLMFWEMGETKSNFWTQIPSGNVKRFGGGSRVQGLTDWEPLEGPKPTGEECQEYTTWQRKFGPVGVPGWQKVMADSPMGIVYRIDAASGVYMVRHRDHNTDTWIECRHTFELIKTPQEFRHYKDWVPAPLGHILGNLDYTQERIPFRHAGNLPGFDVPPDELLEWLQTGDCATMKRHRENVEKEITEHNRKVKQRTTFKINTSTSVDVFKPFQEDVVAPEILSSVGPMVTGVTDMAKLMHELGCDDVAKDLAKSLVHLVNNASWHLRTDRSRYKKA